MENLDLWRLSMELELDGLSNEEAKRRLKGCIDKHLGSSKKSKDKCPDICKMCKANDWLIDVKEHRQICGECGFDKHLLEHCKKEWLPNMAGQIPDYTVLAKETIEGKALPPEILELQRIQREQEKKLYKKKSSIKQSAKQRILKDIGLELNKIYLGGPPNDIIIKLEKWLIDIEKSYNENDSILPRGVQRKAIYVILLWHISDGDLKTILKTFDTVNLKVLEEVVEVLTIIFDNKDFIDKIQKIHITNKIETERCFSNIKRSLKKLRKMIYERFDDLTKKEVNAMSIGLYLLKTSEGKHLYKDQTGGKKGNIGDILRKCQVDHIFNSSKKFGEISKWFDDENIWNQVI